MTRLTTPAAALAEVIVSLGGTILDVRHIGRTGSGERGSTWCPWLPRYTLGEGPSVQMPVAIAGCDAAGSFTLVEASAAGIVVRLVAALAGELVRGEQHITVEVLLASGESTIVLQPGDHATLQLGALELAIRVEAATPVQKFRAQLDRPLWLAQTGVLALFAVLMVVVQHSEPGTAARFDDPDVQANLIRYFSPAEPPAPGEPGTREAASVSTTPTLREAPSTPRAPESKPVVTTTGPVAQSTTELAQHAGILGLPDFLRAIEEAKAAAKQSMTHYVPSARDTAVWVAAAASDPMRELTAGLGLADTTRGGGGDASGVVDLDFGWLFGKTGKPGKLAYGGGKRAAREKFAERDPSSQPEHRQSVVWTASVGRDLIRGVVNRNKPAVRQCFRDGLIKNPGLSGEVEVAFTIESDGTVAYPSIVRSTVADREVEACVTGTIKAWKFPVFVASGGAVDVRFPFTVGAA